MSESHFLRLPGTQMNTMKAQNLTIAFQMYSQLTEAGNLAIWLLVHLVQMHSHSWHFGHSSWSQLLIVIANSKTINKTHTFFIGISF
jgi:hypothetical protein